MRHSRMSSGVYPAANATVPPRLRAYAAIVVGFVAGSLCALTAFKNAVTMDFEYYYRGSQAFARGVNPYALRIGDPGWPIPDALFYPLPALLVMWPAQHFIFPVAAAIFFGGGSAWLAWRLSHEGLWRLWILGGPAMLMAAMLGQWSPLITVGALIPAAGFLLACKPTLGLACFAYRPTWVGAFSVAAISLVSLVLFPSWPLEWVANLRIIANHPLVDHPSPIVRPLGWVLLLALLRWRQPEARLLFAMACVPQLLFFADQLPLGLVARNRGEALALAACGLLAAVTWFVLLRGTQPRIITAEPYVMVGLYLPALIVVLRRPDEGSVPAWVDEAAARIRRRAKAFLQM